MKFEKDVKKQFKVISSFYDNDHTKLTKLIKQIVNIYDITNPTIEDVRIGEGFEIELIGDNIPDRLYKIVIDYEIPSKIIITISDRYYQDLYNINMNGNLVHKERILFKDNKILKIYKKEDSNNNNYLLKYSNEYINADINLIIPKDNSFLINYLAKRIIDYPIDIREENDLYLVINDIVDYKKSSINIKANTRNNKILKKVRSYNGKKGS